MAHAAMDGVESTGLKHFGVVHTFLPQPPFAVGIASSYTARN